MSVASLRLVSPGVVTDSVTFCITSKSDHLLTRPPQNSSSF